MRMVFYYYLEGLFFTLSVCVCVCVCVGDTSLSSFLSNGCRGKKKERESIQEFGRRVCVCVCVCWV